MDRITSDYDRSTPLDTEQLQTALLAETRPVACDQFYTPFATVQACMGHLALAVDLKDFDLAVEPSAGDGAFLAFAPEGVPCLGLDIAPAAPDVVRADFLQWSPPAEVGRILVFGNPPFGRCASGAIAFVNHAARFANVVAMILPASMSKPTMQGRLDPHLHLVAEHPLGSPRFRVPGGDDRAARVVFQIWERRALPRLIQRRAITHADFAWCNDAITADVAIRRVGAHAGKVMTIPAGPLPKGFSPSSNLFARAVGTTPERLRARFRALDLDAVRAQAVANPSLGKADIVEAYECVRSNG